MTAQDFYSNIWLTVLRYSASKTVRFMWMNLYCSCFWTQNFCLGNPFLKVDCYYVFVVQSSGLLFCNAIVTCVSASNIVLLFQPRRVGKLHKLHQTTWTERTYIIIYCFGADIFHSSVKSFSLLCFLQSPFWCFLVFLRQKSSWFRIATTSFLGSGRILLHHYWHICSNLLFGDFLVFLVICRQWLHSFGMFRHFAKINRIVVPSEITTYYFSIL